MKKALYLLFFPFALNAQKDRADMLDKFMQATVAVKNFNGNVLVAKDGHVIYQQSFGYRNYYTRELLDSSSAFEIASITKQFTAMGILLLQQKGKISLSDTLRKYFPNLPYYNVTIKHLLTHTSGIPDYLDSMATNWDHKKIATNSDILQFLSEKKLPSYFQPGQQWKYSDAGYELLASVIEKITGQSFKDYLSSAIFQPLQMDRTKVYARRASKEVFPDYAFGYVYSDSEKKYRLPDSVNMFSTVIYFDGVCGAKSISTTTADLYKWDRALKNNTLLEEKSQLEMLLPQAKIEGVLPGIPTSLVASDFYYSYGEVLGRNELGSYYTHGGYMPGYLTNYIHFSDSDLTVIIFSNNETNPIPICFDLAYICMNKTVVPPSLHKEVKIDPANIDRYVGEYKLVDIPNAFPVILIKRDGKLYQEDSPDKELRPEALNKFFYVNADDQIEFELDSYHQIKKVFFINSGMKKEMKKIK